MEGIPMANGTTLVAAVPVYAGSDEPREWVVVVKWPHSVHGTEWVSARMASLTDPSWSLGHYYSNPANAIADMYLRADVHAFERGDIEAMASRHVISR